MIIKDKTLEPYFIKVEENSYTLVKEQPGKDKKGNNILAKYTIGYFSNLQGALKRVVKEKLSESKEKTTVKDYIYSFQTMLNKFDLIFKNIG